MKITYETSTNGGQEEPTKAQAIVALGLEELIKMATDQGYINPELVAGNIFNHYKAERDKELAELFGRTEKVGRTALVIVNGQVLPIGEHEQITEASV